jgi:hypothetical protein
MGEQPTEPMPEDVREAFRDTIRLYVDGPWGGGYFGNVSGPDRVNHLIVQRECTRVCWAPNS